MDFTKTFGDTTKWAAEISDPDQIPEYVSRAYHIATHGRPGPVVLSIPEDVLSAMSTVADGAPYRALDTSPSARDMTRLRTLLQAAQRPLLIVGGGGWTAEDARAITVFAEANALPVIAGFRSQDIVDNRSASYIGDMSLGGSRNLAARIRNADFLLVIGDRLGDVTTRGYSVIDCPTPKQTLVHVYPAAEELGRVYNAELPIHSGIGQFRRGAVVARCRGCDALAGVARRMPAGISRLPEAAGESAGARSRQGRAASARAAAGHRHRHQRRRQLQHLAAPLFSYRQLGTQVAPKSGAMGYGLSAAIAAQLRCPDRIVVGFAATAAS